MPRTLQGVPSKNQKTCAAAWTPKGYHQISSKFSHKHMCTIMQELFMACHWDGGNPDETYLKMCCGKGFCIRKHATKQTRTCECDCFVFLWESEADAHVTCMGIRAFCSKFVGEIICVYRVYRQTHGTSRGCFVFKHKKNVRAFSISGGVGRDASHCVIPVVAMCRCFLLRKLLCRSCPGNIFSAASM